MYKPQGGLNIFMWREMYMEAQISIINDYHYHNYATIVNTE